MLKDYSFYHGLVFIEILNATGKPVKVQIYPTPSNSSYAINDEIGIYIKYSTKRMSPWRFSFLKEHQEEIDEMSTILSNVFVVLVCHTDGIVCLDYNELRHVLDENHSEVEWISAARSKREKYAVAGSDGNLRVKIGNSDFPRKVLQALDAVSKH